MKKYQEFDINYYQDEDSIFTAQVPAIRGCAGSSRKWRGRPAAPNEPNFAAQFRRIAKRRGKKRAVIAVAHTILTVLYHMLKYDWHYHELGEDFFDRLDPERVTRYHVGRLEDLGYNVTLTKAPVAA